METKFQYSILIVFAVILLHIGGAHSSDRWIDSCKALTETLTSGLRLASHQHNLIGEGSHRSLHTSLKFNSVPERIATELHEHKCGVVAVQRLPCGVFADPFELQRLVQRRVFVDVVVDGDTNLELPSALSGPSSIEIHKDVGFGEELEVEIELPLHARYPPLDSSGYSSVEIGIPDLFMHCSIEEMPERESCSWVIFTNSTEPSPEAKVLWRIPSGNKAHSAIVSTVTFITALLCTLLIVLTTLHKSSALNSEGIAKQE